MTDARDETLEISRAERRGDGTIVVERWSSIWERAWVELRLAGDAVEVHTVVRGCGDIADVRLLGGRCLIPGAPLGPTFSGTRLRRLFSPNPEDGMPPVRDAAAGAVSGV